MSTPEIGGKPRRNRPERRIVPAVTSGLQWSALAAAAAALVTLVVGLSALIQKIRSDNRAEWWRRVQWAVERTHEDGPLQREAGLISLLHLVESRLATKADQRLIRDIALSLCRRYREEF